MKEQGRLELGPHFSEGARLMWAALEARGWTQQAAMRELTLKAGQVARLLYGDRKPARQTAEKLRAALGIDPAEWDRLPTLAFIPPAARAKLSSKSKGRGIQASRSLRRSSSAPQDPPPSSPRPPIATKKPRRSTLRSATPKAAPRRRAAA